MQVKTYTAATKLEALLKIREELGPEAVILSERKVERGGFLGLFRRPMVEIVVATKEVPAAVSNPLTTTDTYDPLQKRLKRLEQEMQEVRALITMVRTRLETENEPPSRSHASVNSSVEHPLLSQLLEMGVEPSLARQLRAQIPEDDTELNQREHLRRAIMRFLPVGGALPERPPQRQVVALVGPTGVGKTTTIAKLAARHALEFRQRVGLISVDTYRIGAIEQLRTYAQIMDLPLHIAYNGEEVVEGLQQLNACDLVLIDTIGRSQRDQEHLQELHAALQPAQAMVYLTVSTTADPHVLYDVADRFALFQPSRLILTKLDETVCWGSLLNLIAHRRLPIAYCTDGQRVPEDLREADVRWLSAKILKQEKVSPLVM